MPTAFESPDPDPERARVTTADEVASAPWRLWGPYLSERQWGTVREDYSAGGTAWEYLPHDHARSRAYRWEDGIEGISEIHQDLTAAAVDSTRLAQMRYEGGVTSYLEVLDSETRSFAAEIDLAQAELNERLALMRLYAALGGGWQPEPSPGPATPKQ